MADEKPKKEKSKRSKLYNTTELNVDGDFANHVFHRDRFAHYLRWSYVLRNCIAEQSLVLDVGCGHGNLLKVLYANRCAPERYLGLDVRSQLMRTVSDAWSDKTFAEFFVHDAVTDPCPTVGSVYGDDLYAGRSWNFVTCFEVLEHVGKENVPAMLENIAAAGGPDTKFMFSTPVYDEKVGAAANHTLDGVVAEMTIAELRPMIEEKFVISQRFGTFASKRDVLNAVKGGSIPGMSGVDAVAFLKIYEELERYYNPDVMSVLFAPLFPDQSRNILWECMLKA